MRSRVLDICLRLRIRSLTPRLPPRDLFHRRLFVLPEIIAGTRRAFRDASFSTFSRKVTVGAFSGKTTSFVAPEWWLEVYFQGPELQFGDYDARGETAVGFRV
jgi:hypothetical protein